MQIDYSTPTPMDKQILMRLDQKCHDYPFSDSHWCKVLDPSPENVESKNLSCVTMRRKGQIIGFYVYWSSLLISSENDTERAASNVLILTALGIDPEHRRMGYGSLLVGHAHRKARTLGFDCFSITIPEYYFYEDENRGLKEFANENGLSAAVIAPELFPHYGKVFDGITFKSRS